MPTLLYSFSASAFKICTRKERFYQYNCYRELVSDVSWLVFDMFVVISDCIFVGARIKAFND